MLALSNSSHPLSLLALVLVGCSFQNFDYLSDKHGSAGGSGGGSSGSAGSSGSSGVSGHSGSTSTGGGAGSSGAPSGGASGAADAGSGGDSGSSGTSGSGSSTLVNVSFENGYTGWLFDPASAMGVYAYVQWPPNNGTTVDGKNELSTWADSTAFSVRVYQSLDGLTDGLYTFKGNFNRGDGLNAAQIFARNCGGADKVGDIPLTSPTQWIEVGISGIQVVGGHCEVGLFVDSNPSNWLNADLFSFAQDPQ